MGMIPLMVFVIDYFKALEVNLFFISSVATMLAFVIIGLLKGHLNETNKWRSMLETLFLGASAAALSYVVGAILEKMF
jgi:VIT1/CCC1 family predicted Fe2+/Mn2+ transporter